MIREICPGLTYWTAPHPEWESEATPEGPADWPRNVGCVLVEVDREPVLIDPLLGDWGWLDARIAGRPVHVLRTVRFHDRDRAAVLERYGGDEDPPSGVEAFAVPGENVYWLPEYAALVPGDSVIGDGRRGLRLCPESWLRHHDAGLTELRAALEPLLDLPVQRVLVSHGEPVLKDARAALRSSLSRSSPR